MFDSYCFPGGHNTANVLFHSAFMDEIRNFSFLKELLFSLGET